MHVEVVRSEKHEVELNLDNSTVAEILRVYLNEAGIDFAAWKKEHYSKPIVMLIKSESNLKKQVSDAIAAIEKDLDQVRAVVKKK